ncbi:putative transcription factor GRAS [Helianthus debilis subsp. tardiflorus]
MENQKEIEKLHPLFKEDDSRDQHLDALFQDTTPPLCSYEHNMQELTDIESQYSELIKPRAPSDHDGVAKTEASDQRKLSTDEVIRLGGERFIQSRSSTSMNEMLILTHPYPVSFSGGLSDQELKDVQLFENLLLSSEKVAHQQFDRSLKLLDQCDVLATSSGNPIRVLLFEIVTREDR